ncbi:unnamed protein product [Effrenium voratum]|uniref:Uncharacterized protein n=1 Tax=Effrenium voratum TaxID=2562239 RepID=A0AA36IFA8_9DINO|nr:unnamed protein product [Effrenium voratum]
MGAIILATLLEAAPADVRVEFEHLGSYVLGDLAAAQEELRALAKDKLLAVLPAVSFQALLDYAVETGKFAEVAATLFCVSASELEVLRNKLQNGGPLTFLALEANVNGGEAKITPALQGFRYETATGIQAAALANQETALWDATATLLTQEWQPHNAAKDYASVLGQLSACALLDCHAQAQQETEYLHGRVFQLNNVHIPFPPPEDLYEDRIYWTARIRDFSGCLDVGIRSSSHCAADTLSWPLLASVKILATVRDADVAATQAQDSQSGMKRMRFVLVEAEEQDLKQEATQPLLSLLQLQQRVSSKRTEQQEAASGLRLVTKDIIDGLAEADAAAAEKFTAIAYCTVHNLKDFVLDPPRTGKKLQYALAIACSKSATEGQAELIVEQLQLLREADVDVATKCMRQLLLMSSVTATRGPPPGTHAPWTESTAPALQQALCPALSAYPRGEPWANAPTAPGVHACSD